MLRWQHSIKRALTTSRFRLLPIVLEDEHHEEEAEEDFVFAIASLCEKGQLDRAMELLQQQDALLPPATYWSLLKLCNKKGSLHHAKHVGAHMAMHYMPPTLITVNEYLVLTFCKCHDLESALVLFHSLPIRTVFSWTAIISGYMDCGQGALALQVYATMLEECMLPNEYTYISLLKACSSLANLQLGKILHACAWKNGLHSHIMFASSLVGMYSKCGAVTEAEKAFLASPQHDVVSWTSMISALIKHELVDKAMILYRKMQEQGVAPNEWTVSCCLQGCYILAENKVTLVLKEELGEMVPLEIGRALHNDAILRGFEGQMFVGNDVLRMYGKCGCISEAELVFCSLPNHDVVSWTSILSLYVEQGEAEKAVKVYRQMLESHTNPDKLAVLTTLQACCVLTTWDEHNVNRQHPPCLLALEMGQALHAHARKKGFVSDSFVGNTMVHLFAKCRKYVDAETIFSDLCERDVVSWTVMLPAYFEQGQAKKAMQLYQQMQKEGVSPDEQTLANVLKACCKYADEEVEEIEEGTPVSQVALEVGKALHHDAVERGHDDSRLDTELVSLYGKCGSIAEAEHSFKRLLHPDAVAYSAMLSSYVKEAQKKKALQLYVQILTQGTVVEDAIHGYMLQFCCTSRSFKDCKRMHHSIWWSASSSVSLELATRLIFVYASCESASDAWAVLSSLSAPDVVAWNALMSGLIQSGDYAGAFRTFEEMQVAGIHPNQATFLSVLSACSQAGLIQRGVDYLESMDGVYRVDPGIQHFGCLIDLLGRMGDFDRVKEFLSTMQVRPDIAMWLGLLSACLVHGNVELGELAYEHAVRLQPRQAAAYVLMFNIFTNAGMQDQANEVDLSRQKACAWKKPGQSSISINDTLRTFVVNESIISQEECFAHLLQKKHVVWRLEGYIPQIEYQSS